MRGNADLKKHGVSVTIFSMPNINLNDKTVYGTMISGGNAANIKTELPALVFNFAVQHTKKDIKKLMVLAETENVTLINSANSFNQWTIMKMLISDPETKQYVLPFADISSKDRSFDFDNTGSFIIRPQNGSDCSKIIICRKSESGFDLYNAGGIAYSHVFDIHSAIIPAIRSGKRVLSITPELVGSKNKLLIIRSYLYKVCDGKWKIAYRTPIDESGQCNETDDRKINTALMQMMGCINCFITDLAFCSIDLVLGSDGTPFFLSLGGWQDLMPGKKKHNTLLKILCQSITDYAETIHP
jgi:hypothetical protein